uniref:Uncharacterized protein n=1 Tax=Tanacetum cinerariifolium TaxID=118510 RepID=A0A699GK79_TANCI|nr:hypothetical protein [Tanacetum cinerariifolium]
MFQVGSCNVSAKCTRGFDGLLPLASEEEEAKRIVKDEELLSNMVEASVSSVNDDSFNKSMLHTISKGVEVHGANISVKVNGASILVFVKNILEMISKSLCVTRSGNNLFLKRITQRSKYPHLDEIIKLTPFGVSTSSVGFDMSFKTDTPNVNEREKTLRVVVMVFKVQFNGDLVMDAKGMSLSIGEVGGGSGVVCSTAIGVRVIEPTVERKKGEDV